MTLIEGEFIVEYTSKMTLLASFLTLPHNLFLGRKNRLYGERRGGNLDNLPIRKQRSIHVDATWTSNVESTWTVKLTIKRQVSGFTT